MAAFNLLVCAPASLLLLARALAIVLAHGAGPRLALGQAQLASADPEILISDPDLQQTTNQLEASQPQDRAQAAPGRHRHLAPSNPLHSLQRAHRRRHHQHQHQQQQQQQQQQQPHHLPHLSNAHHQHHQHDRQAGRRRRHPAARHQPSGQQPAPDQPHLETAHQLASLVDQDWRRYSNLIQRNYHHLLPPPYDVQPDAGPTATPDGDQPERDHQQRRRHHQHHQPHHHHHQYQISGSTGQHYSAENLLISPQELSPAYSMPSRTHEDDDEHDDEGADDDDADDADAEADDEIVLLADAADQYHTSTPASSKPHYANIIHGPSNLVGPLGLGASYWQDSHLASIKIEQESGQHDRGSLNGAMIAIMFGVGVTGMLIMVVTHKMRSIRRCAAWKNPRRSLVPDTDILIQTIPI